MKGWFFPHATLVQSSQDAEDTNLDSDQPGVVPWCKMKNVPYIVGGRSGYNGALAETCIVDTVDRTERALVNLKSV